MRVFVMLAMFAFFGQSASAQMYFNPYQSETSNKNLLQKLIENSVFRNIALHKVISNRCSHYLKSYYEQRTCKFATTEILRALNFDVEFLAEGTKDSDNKWETGAFVFIAFKDSFNKMMSMKTINDYLVSVSNGYNSFYNEVFEFNLWEHTVNYFKGNEDVAAHVIAILFQDTSTVKLHIRYSRRNFKDKTDLYQQNLDMLDMLIDNFNFSLEMNKERYLKSIFPKGMANYRNTSLYHFYVPLYLAKRLKLRGYSNRVAATTAFMLTMTYEMVSADPKYKEYIWKDPAKVTSSWKVQDIFQGYSGALMGVGFKSKIKSFQTAKKYFSESTKKGALYLTNF